MKKIFAVTTLAMMLAASPAFASQCPKLIKDASNMMNSMSLDDETMKKVMDLLDKSQKEHDACKHTESEADAQAAMKATGM